MRLAPSATFRTANAWAAAAAVGLLLAVGLTTAPVATADACDNAALRAQNNSTELPDCRAYEMVSPSYKGGFPVLPGTASVGSDETIVSYQSRGAFAGNAQGNPTSTYHAKRSTAGWLTSSLDPPAETYGISLDGQVGQPVIDESNDLRWSLWKMYLLEEGEASIGFWLRGPNGAFTRMGDANGPGGRLSVRGASATDLSHIVVSSGTSGSASATAQYEYVGTGNDGPPRPTSIDNLGERTPGEICMRNVSDDGRVIVFVSGCNGGITQVWARVAGTATVAVSRSECTRPFGHPDGTCNGVSAAEYAGAAADGSRVFFTTDQQLVNGDIDQTSDLYACDIPAGVPAPVGSSNACSTLAQVSGIASGAQVVSVPVVSKDGSRVYFIAAGAALADNLGVNGAAPVAGQPNLYLWAKDAAHPAGQVKFVAGLDANDVGVPDDRSGPQLTSDMRYLVFTTATALVTGGPSADTDGARDVYRYDSKTHEIARVSTSVVGGGGNGVGFDVFPNGASFLPAMMSADGSTVVFDSAEALSASDTNGVTDVYRWRDGQVSLISAGGGNAVGVTPSGRDIFFTTNASVLAADGDAVTDIYTARIGGGFDPPRPPALCSGDGCQGLMSSFPALAGPRSGLSGDSGPDAAGAALSLRLVTAAQRRRLVATGKLALTVTAKATGRVTATARAKIGRRSVVVASGRRTMTTPGSVAIALKLSRKARGQLSRRGRLTVKVVVRHSEATKAQSVTLKLTRKRAKPSVGGRS